MEIKYLIKEAYSNAVDHGFHDCYNKAVNQATMKKVNNENNDYEKEVENKKFIYVTNKEGMENYQGEIIGTAAGEVVLLWV